MQPRSTPNSARSSSRWPWPSSPPRPTTSPAPTEREMSRSRLVQLELPALEHRRFEDSFPAHLPGWKDVAVFAADHHLDHVVVGLGAGLVGRDIASVAEHRADIRQFGDLVHPMRDEQQRHAVRRAAASAPRRPWSRRRPSGPRSLRRGSGCADCAPEPWLSRPSVGATAAGRQPPPQDECPRRRRGRAPPRRSAVVPCGLSCRNASADRRSTTLSATLRSGMSDSSWKMQAMPGLVGRGRRGEAHRLALHLSVALRPARPRPAMILMSVDLPAPFSPSMAWICPGSTVRSAASSARTPP